MKPIKCYFIKPESLRKIWKNEGLQNLVCHSLKKFAKTSKFLGLFGAVKGQHGEVNKHNWDWNRYYPFWNKNFFSGTVSLNEAIVAFYLAGAYCTVNLFLKFSSFVPIFEIQTLTENVDPSTIYHWCYNSISLVLTV